MSWISDVKTQLSGLDDSRRRLRRFGLLVGGVFLLLGIGLLWKDRTSSAGLICAIVGSLLIVLGAFLPAILKPVYRVWMGVAFAVGWIVSRVILIVLFILVITPIGLVLRLFRKKMLDLQFPGDCDSYWVLKRSDGAINYEKMY